MGIFVPSKPIRFIITYSGMAKAIGGKTLSKSTHKIPAFFKRKAKRARENIYAQGTPAHTAIASETKATCKLFTIELPICLNLNNETKWLKVNEWGRMESFAVNSALLRMESDSIQ